VNSFSGKGVFPAKYAFTLLIPLRNIFLSPKKLLHRLDLREDHTVLEIGPGPGYFSTVVAKKIPKGTFVLADIQQEMLDISRKRIEKKKLGNVDFVLCDGQHLNFADEYFDRIFMVAVIGEIENQASYLKEISRIMKHDGILSISELAGDPDKLNVEELQALLRSHGFVESGFFGSRRNYTMNFKKN
jgi:ubiquinone/menaquinone biosynthesis C-methylase UbiE